jgi:hypothetical protein
LFTKGCARIGNGIFHRAYMSGQLVVNLTNGSLAFGFAPTAARELRAEIDGLLASLKNKGAGPQANMEYQYTGEVFMEIFCNPNIWPTPFTARVLVTLRDDRIRVSTETELTGLIQDLDLYLEQHG